MKHRKLTAVPALLLTLALLAGCGGSGSSPGSSSNPAASSSSTAASQAPEAEPAPSGIVTPPGEFPIVTEPVTLNFFAAQSANIPDIETNTFTTMYEEKTGVHINWELAPSNAMAEKKSISLASGQYPDVYLGASITREEEMTYGPKGIFVDLSPYIEQYNPELQKCIDREPLIATMMRAHDGKVYSYPNVQITLHVEYANRLWINSTWLKDLGLEAPKTTDEYYEVLKAFQADVNGNGKGDEIPLILANVLSNPTSGGSSNAGIAPLMCPFIYYDGKDGFIVSDDDRVSVSYNTEEWREGLRYLNRLYAEGLLDKSSFTVTNDQIKQLVENEDAMFVGGLCALAPSGFANLAGERHKNYDAVTPLVGPNGNQTVAWDPYIHTMGSLVVTNACQYPEVVARWIDWLYTWEGALTAREGPENVSWQRPAPGTLSYTGEEATWERITTYGEASNFKWDGMGFPHNMLIHPEQAADNDIYAPGGQPARLYQIAKNQLEPYRPAKVYPPVYMSPDVIKDYSKMKTDINKFIEDYSVRFITGVADLDADWDGYLASLERMNLEEYLRLSQEAYDTFLANAK